MRSDTTSCKRKKWEQNRKEQNTTGNKGGVHGEHIARARARDELRVRKRSLNKIIIK